MGLLDGLNLGDALKGVLGQIEAAGFPPPLMRCWPRRSITTLTVSPPRCRRAAWLGPGGNLPITEDQLKAVLGNAQVQDFARHLGLPVDATLKILAQYLPEIVDKASPDGVIQSK